MVFLSEEAIAQAQRTKPPPTPPPSPPAGSFTTSAPPLPGPSAFPTPTGPWAQSALLQGLLGGGDATAQGNRALSDRGQLTRGLGLKAGPGLDTLLETVQLADAATEISARNINSAYANLTPGWLDSILNTQARSYQNQLGLLGIDSPGFLEDAPFSRLRSYGEEEARKTYEMVRGGESVEELAQALSLIHI